MWSQRSRAKRRGVKNAARSFVELLESRFLLSAVSWTGNGDHTSWSDPANWSGDAVPGAADNVTINVGGNPTITFSAAAGTVSIQSLNCSNAMVISGGLLTITGAGAIKASQITGGLTMTGGSLDLTGSGTTLSANGTAGVANASLEADNGATLTLTQSAGLTADNLTTTGGGQLLFPMATSFASYTNTIQATGAGSTINLSALGTLTNTYEFDSTGVTAATGGTIDLAGQVGGGGGIQLTLADAASTLNVAPVTTLNNVSVTATAGTMNFANATMLTAVNLTASGGGQLLFPAATSFASYTNTIQATGAGSTINLSALGTLTNTYEFDSTGVTAATGGTIDLAGQVGGGGGIQLTLADAASTLNVAPVTTLNNVSVTATAGTMNFANATMLTAVNLTASGGGQLLFPAATSFASYTNTIQATGAGSTINLSALGTLTNTYEFDSTGVTAATGGTIDLAGQVGGGGGIQLTLADAASTLNVAPVTTLNNVSVTATAGTMNFANATMLTAVNLTASGGGQLLFPAATSFASYTNTIQATGAGSTINLSALGTLTNTYEFDSTGVTAATGGTIDLAGQVGGGGGIQLTLADAASTLNVAPVTTLNNVSVTATAGTMNFANATMLTAVNLTASGGGQLLFPAATSFASYTNTIQATGAGSTINLSALGTLTNTYEFDSTGVTAATGGTIDLAGQVGGGGGIQFNLDGGALNIDGSYNIPASDPIDVGIGTTGAGKLNILGAAPLTGTLNIGLLNGFVPPAGASYGIIAADSVTGSFGTMSGLTQTGVTFSPVSTTTGFLLSTGMGAAATTATLTTSGAVITAGNSATFTATFASALAGGTAPTGTALFFDGATEIGSSPLDAAGSASFSTSDLEPGTHTITVNYSGDANYTPNTSAPLAETVNGAHIIVASLDPTFSPATGDIVPLTFTTEQVLQEPGAAGDILLVGHEGVAAQNTLQGVLEQLNSDGSVDTTFGVDGSATTNPPDADSFLSAALQSNGQIVAVGSSNGDFLVARYNGDGTLDTTFGTGGFATVGFGADGAAVASSVAIEPDGSIVVGGQAGNVFAVARFTAGGVLDGSFNPLGQDDATFPAGGQRTISTGSVNAAGAVQQIVIDGDGNILGVGASGNNVAVFELKANGANDLSFGTSGIAIIDKLSSIDPNSMIAVPEGVALQPGGDVLVAGEGASGGFAAVRLMPNGQLDPTFGTGGIVTASFGGAYDDLTGIAADPSSGQFLLVGTTTNSSETTLVALAAFNPDGTVNTTFAHNGQLVLADPSVLGTQLGASAIPESLTPASVSTPLSASPSAAFSLVDPLAYHPQRDDIISATIGADNKPILTVSSFQSGSVARFNPLAPSSVLIGNFGKMGHKNARLPFTLDGTSVTITSTGGSGMAYSVGNELELTLSGNISVTITTHGGENSLNLASVSVSTGSALHELTAPTATVTGFLDAPNAVSMLKLAGITGVVVASAISTLDVKSMSGTIDCAGVLAAAKFGAVSGLIAASTIDSLTANTLSGADILAGLNLGQDAEIGPDDTYGPGQIDTLSVAGPISDSFIGAGVIPMVGVFGYGGDTSAGAGSIIRSISVKSGIDAASLFEAAAFPKIVHMPAKTSTAGNAQFVVLG